MVNSLSAMLSRLGMPLGAPGGPTSPSPAERARPWAAESAAAVGAVVLEVAARGVPGVPDPGGFMIGVGGGDAQGGEGGSAPTAPAAAVRGYVTALSRHLAAVDVLAAPYHAPLGDDSLAV